MFSWDFGLFPILDDFAAKLTLNHLLFQKERLSFAVYKYLIYSGILAPIILISFGRLLLVDSYYWIVVCFFAATTSIAIFVWGFTQAPSILQRNKEPTEEPTEESTKNRKIDHS